MNKKKWSDFTNGELITALGNIYDWELKKKIYKVLKHRGITLGDQYYGRYDPDGTTQDDEARETFGRKKTQK